MPVAIPPPVDKLVAAINRGDTEAFLALFPADGVVDDWGRRMVGHAAIRAWSDKETIGAKGVMTVTKASATSNQVLVDADWKSTFYSGSGSYVFTIANGKVREMRIVGD